MPGLNSASSPTRFLIALLVLALLSSCTHQPAPPTPTPGNVAAHSALTSTIAALDSALFSAFNAHDADRLGTYFTPDLEFSRLSRSSPIHQRFRTHSARVRVPDTTCASAAATPQLSRKKPTSKGHFHARARSSRPS